MKSQPPKIPLRFFRWYCHPKLLDSIEGDLLELYQERVIEKGKRKADLKFTLEVLLLFRPGIIKSLTGYKRLNNYGMLKNYFITSFRNLIRNKSYTAINVAGLALGIAGSLVLYLIIKQSDSFDKYHTNTKRTYRIVSKVKTNEGFTYTQAAPGALKDVLQEEIPAIDNTSFLSYRRESLITIVRPNEVKKYEEPVGLTYGDAGFFKIFDRKIIYGAAQEILKSNEAVISKQWALKFFQKEEATGELIEFEGNQFKITSVMEDYPDNTDLPFDMILSFATIENSVSKKNWYDLSDADNCYITLKNGQNPTTVENGLKKLNVKYYHTDSFGQPEHEFILQPLSTLHSDMRFGNYNTKLPREAQIVFSIIALFLLLSACINFINLTTAEAVKRAREVGVRKILGSNRRQLLYQFNIETLLVTLCSIVIAVVVAELSVSTIRSLMGFPISINLFSDQSLWIFLISTFCAVTLIAGFYPAWVVSGYKPILAIKGHTNEGGRTGIALRKSLVVVQFFISQLFIIATITLTRQMNFMQQHDLGFAKEAVVTLPIPPDSNKEIRALKMKRLKNEVLQLNPVEGVSLSFAPPSFKAVIGMNYHLAGSADELGTQVKQVDDDYIDLYKIELLYGHKLQNSDSATEVLVNEKFAHLSGIADARDMVGKEIVFEGQTKKVEGVVRDFNTQSLSDKIEPVLLMNHINAYQILSVKLNASKLNEGLGQLETLWKKEYPEYVFHYSFVEDQIRDLYKMERRISSLLTGISFIAIFIGCLGLLGLVAFVANRKAKEMGIRRVLGASVRSIIFLFSKEFGLLILIGFAFSAPLAGWLMQALLNQFAYRIDLSIGIFLTGLLITCGVTVLTVGSRSYKAATVNPSESLRSE